MVKCAVWGGTDDVEKVVWIYIAVPVYQMWEGECTVLQIQSPTQWHFGQPYRYVQRNSQVNWDSVTMDRLYLICNGFVPRKSFAKRKFIKRKRFSY